MRSTLSISYLILRRRVSAVSKDAPQARTILRPRLIDRAQHPEAVPLGVQLEVAVGHRVGRSEEHTSELQSLMRISYAVFCLKKKNRISTQSTRINNLRIQIP